MTKNQAVALIASIKTALLQYNPENNYGIEGFKVLFSELKTAINASENQYPLTIYNTLYQTKNDFMTAFQDNLVLKILCKIIGDVDDLKIGAVVSDIYDYISYFNGQIDDLWTAIEILDPEGIVTVLGNKVNRYSSTLDPGATNDGVDTAAIGTRFYICDIWINTSTSKIFVCFDNTTGNADWKEIPKKTDVPTALSQLTDDSTHRLVTDTEKNTWNGKQDSLGFTPENVSNKVSAFQVTPDNTHYPTEKLVKDSIPTALSQLTDDSTHRLVTDTEKSTWNGKENALTFSTGLQRSVNTITTKDSEINHNNLQNYDAARHFLKGDINLDDLGNVTLPTPTTGDVVKWSGSAWVNDPGLTNVQSIFTDTKEPTGFINTTDSSFSFVDGTRTFTIAPVSTSYSFYIKGVKHTISVSKSIVISNVEGVHYIYFDTDDVLHEYDPNSGFNSLLITEKAYVSALYWNTDESIQIYLADERHGITMDGQTHLNLHQTQGTKYISGLALGNFVIGDGSLSTHAEFSTTAGYIQDEDLLFSISAKTVPAQMYIFYRNSTGKWKRTINQNNYPVLFSGSVSDTYYDSASNFTLAYNLNTAGSWSLAKVTNNNYVLTHYFAINDYTDGYRIIGVCGQAQYTTISNARIGANTELNNLILSGLPFREFIPIATVIFETNSTYGNTPKAKIVLTDTGANYVDWSKSKLSPSINPVSHANLTELDYYSSGHTGFGSSSDITDLQDQIDSLSASSPLALYKFMPITGLIMSNNASDLTNDIDFTAGSCIDDTNAYIITSSSAVTKRLDATFTAGTGNGMLDTGSKANNTIYHIFAIGKTTDSTAEDKLASTSATSPTMPSGWDIKKLIRTVRTDQNGVIWIIDNRNDNSYGVKYTNSIIDAGLPIGANDQHFFQFTSPNNMTINKLYFILNSATAGKKINAGIYADNGSSAPGALITQIQPITLQASDLSWSYNDLILCLRSSVNLTAMTKYWVSLWPEAAINLQKSASTQRALYKNATYSDTLSSSVTSLSGTSFCHFQLF